MQISDLMGQYSQSAGTETVTATKGVESFVSSVNSLTKGNIFEGTVSSVKNGRVTLALSNGSFLSARLEGKVSLSEGQSMFFQVKSNDGTQIAIRPFSVDGNGVNYTLMQALSAAGLPTQSNYLSMVNKMMEEQMPIDRSSLQQMAKLVNTNADIDVQTLVEMNKLGIEVTPENAAQFENYLGDRQAITAAIDNLIEELPTAMQGSGLPEESVSQMDAQVLGIMTEGLTDAPAGEESASVLGEPAAAADNLLMEAAKNPVPAAEQTMEQTAEQTTEQTAEPVGTQSAEQTAAQVHEETTQPPQGEEQILETGEAGRAQSAQTNADTVSQENTALPQEHTLGAVLNQAQLENLNEMLGKLLGQQSLNYTAQKGTAGLLMDLQQLLGSEYPVDGESLQKLLSSDEFKALVKDVLQQQWTIRPEELTGSDKVNRLYEKLEGQMSRMESVMKMTGQENTAFTQTAADIRGNVQFMNQINQLYTYVQIPLKMSGQNASGQLYVYTNKKSIAEGDKALTAFLHLDMDNLGPTDVSVRMLGKEVSTNFYLENDEAYDLIEQYLPLLEDKLRQMGYNCSVSVTNESRHVNFVEDFLKKDQPSAGQLHRYSFDMRA